MSDASTVPAAPTYFRGEWLSPGVEGYDDRRRHYNTRFDRRPHLIARCDGVQDVRLAVALAQAQGLEIAVRGGGRSFGGHSTIDGGMLIDLSLMNDVHVDPVRRTALVRPGATQGAVLIETSPYDLAPVTGVTSHVGFTGAAIYSGMGHLSPRHGFTCDGILSAEIVLADGRLVTASPTSHADLYWAIRGAGDNFGVVVSLEVQLHPVPATAQFGFWAWDAANAAAAMRAHREMDATISDELFWLAELGVSDETERELEFSITAIHVGSPDAAAREFGAIDAFGINPVKRTIEGMDWVAIHHVFDEAWPSTRQYWAGGDLIDLDDQALELLLAEGHRMVDEAAAASTAFIVYSPYHHSMLRQVASPPAALNRRRGGELTAAVFYPAAADDRHFAAWGEGVVGRFRDRGLLYPGATANYTTHVDIREVWGPDYGRLAAIKAVYDPGNIFHLNLNILPEAPSHAPADDDGRPVVADC